MRCFITGVAGFVGSNLADRLLAEGHEVIGYDNFSTGSLENIRNALTYSQKFKCSKADILNRKDMVRGMAGCDIVFHLAANADVRYGLENPAKDLEQNTEGTFSVLEAMRESGVKRIVFSSTGSVYGKPDIFPTPERTPFPIQNSLYGASKLAGEGLIQAYCEGYDFQSWIFRFVSLLGKRYRKGFVVDFYKKLKADPKTLQVLGDGTVKKSCLNVKDCIDAMLIAIKKSNDKVNIFNLGTDEFLSVKDCAQKVASYILLKPKFNYQEEKLGWVGDSPFIYLNCNKIRALGWKPKYTIKESIEETLEYLIDQDCRNSL